MSDAITPWFHILAVAVWLGPQVFLFVAAIPAVRLVEDQQLRVRLLRLITQRFGWLAWGALLVIVLSGVSNLFQEQADTPLDLSSSDFRYFHVFSLKMVLAGIMVILTALHSFVIGPRQLRLQEEGQADSPQAARLRRTGIIVSGLVLALSIAVVYVAALLANHDYSFQPT